jgi:hypothetical protein
MSFESEPLLKRKREDKNFIELSNDELLEAFEQDQEFAEYLKSKQAEAKEKFEQNREEGKDEKPLPSWKKELQMRLEKAETLEDVDSLTKELVKKNKPRKQPKKKLVRVDNFYQRHISGLQWMNNFLHRTKTDACSRPFVERMLELENQFKKIIEEDPLLGAHLEKEN